MFDYIKKGRYWDKPWTLVSGCTPCSPGCTHCWALAMERRFRFTPYKGCGAKLHDTSIRVHPERLDIPLKRKKPTVWALWNDIYHEDVPTTFIDGAWDIMRRADKHIFLVLTKRIKRAEEFFRFKTPYPNIWPGVTVCNQQEAYEKQSTHKNIPGKKFISIEPMLSDIPFLMLDGIDWVICGGETGPGARPMHPSWARSIRDQCQSAGVPFLFKKHGSWNESYFKGSRFDPTNTGRLLDGKEWNELPYFKEGSCQK